MTLSDITEASIVGAPLDLGAARRGVDMGPSAIRLARLSERLEAIGADVVDRGNVVAELPEVAPLKDERVRYLPAILRSCAQIAAGVREVASEGRTPIVLGGDHSIAMGSFAGAANYYRKREQTLGLIWFNAGSSFGEKPAMRVSSGAP